MKVCYLDPAELDLCVEEYAVLAEISVAALDCEEHSLYESWMNCPHGGKYKPQEVADEDSAQPMPPRAEG
jgi:hypothetical protein